MLVDKKIIIDTMKDDFVEDFKDIFNSLNEMKKDGLDIEGVDETLEEVTLVTNQLEKMTSKYRKGQYNLDDVSRVGFGLSVFGTLKDEYKSVSVKNNRNKVEDAASRSISAAQDCVRDVRNLFGFKAS